MIIVGFLLRQIVSLSFFKFSKLIFSLFLLSTSIKLQFLLIVDLLCFALITKQIFQLTPIETLLPLLNSPMIDTLTFRLALFSFTLVTGLKHIPELLQDLKSNLLDLEKECYL